MIVSPALAEANNGNWQTARRWREFLAGSFDARIVQQWPDNDAQRDGVMLALHARRSAQSIDRWAREHPGSGLAVVLTGTDLYQDIAVDAQARRSLELAQRLVVLQELGLQAVPPALRPRCTTIFQSAQSQAPAPKPATVLQAVMVGHLREVKRPQTLFEAARLLAEDDDIRIDHIGDALEPALGEQALATQRACPNYRWLGPLPHEATREQIRRAHLLVNTSAMEGGAHVIIEAILSGTAVLASRIPGNVGMLGAGYQGYFAPGDAAELARLLRRCRQGQRVASDAPSAPLLVTLGAQCALRAGLFAPEVERAGLLRLVSELMEPTP